jgi:hypothetical protein
MEGENSLKDRDRTPSNSEGRTLDDVDAQIITFLEWFKEKYDKATFGEITTSLISLLLVILGIIGACIYYGQLSEMRRTNNLTQKALNASDETLSKTLSKMQGQIDATNSLVVASLKANKLTEESVRGKVSMYTQILSPIQPSGKLDISVTLTNVGHSPVLIRSKSVVKEWHELPEGGMPVVLTTADRLDVLQPNDKSVIYATLSHNFSADDIAQIDNGTKTPFVFGKVSYETLGKHHGFDFCFYVIKISPNQPAFPEFGVDPQHALRVCPKWDDNEN